MEYYLLSLLLAGAGIFLLARYATRRPPRYDWLVSGRKGYRTMQAGWVEWTPEQAKAIRFARRVDAEMFAAEDDDAWRIIQVPHE